jgi:hypothetical protein
MGTATHGGLFDRFIDAQFWRRVNPRLTLSDDPPPAPGFPVDPELAERLGRAARRERRLQVDDALPLALVALLANGVERLAAIGCPPVFLFVYDEPWHVLARAVPIVEAALGGSVAQLPELWVWHVEGRNDADGWFPQRERAPRWLFPEGAPRSLTLWVPLAGEPPPQGSLLAWIHDVPHWGGRASRPAPRHRTSFSCDFQRADLPPYLTPLLDPRRAPSWSARLSLIGRQVLRQRPTQVVPEKLAELAQRLVGLG